MRTIKMMRTLGVLAVIACLGLLTGCPRTREPGPSTNGPQPQTGIQVRMGSFSKAVDYGPYLVAKNKRSFEEALKPLNATPTYEVFQSLAPINESLGSNKVDIVFEAEPPAIVGKAAGIDVKIAAVSCSLTQEVLVHKGGNVKAVVDLKGKKIAVLAGTSSHYGLLKILEKVGLTKNDVSIVDMVPPDAKTAFETDKVDAWAVWPPFVEQEEISGKGTTLGGGTAYIYSIMAARGGFLSEHRDICQALAGVVEQTKAWMIEHPDDSQQIIAKELDVPLDVIKRAWPRHDWKAQLTDSVLADIQAKADFLKSAAFIKQPVVVKGDLIDTSLSGAKK